MLLNRLESDRLFYPSAGPYMMIDVYGDDLAFATKLAGRGLITVPGSSFGKVTTGLIRINVALPLNNLIRACEMLCEAL